MARHHTGCAGGYRSSAGRRSSLGRHRLGAELGRHSRLNSVRYNFVHRESRPAYLVHHSHLDLAVRSLRAAAAAHHNLPGNHTGSDRAGSDRAVALRHIDLVDHRAAVDRHVPRVAVRVRASRSCAVGLENHCCVVHLVGMMLVVRYRCTSPLKRRQSYGYNHSRYWKACCATTISEGASRLNL